MLKSEFIYQYSLLDALKNTTGISGKERANIVRAKVKGSVLYDSLKEEFEELLKTENLDSATDIIKHNQRIQNFRKSLTEEEIDFEPVRLAEKTFEAICGKVTNSVTIDLIVDKRELSDDDYLCYLYSALVK